MSEFAGLIFVCFAENPPPIAAAADAITAHVGSYRPEATQVVATVSAPIMLGEIALLTGHAISATVRAHSDCDCYVLTRSQFHRLTEQGNAAAYKLVMAMAQLLAHRLTAMNDRVIALSHG